MIAITFVTLLLCFHFSRAYTLFGLANDNLFFQKELNATFESFDRASISTKWIEQPLDHFNDSETRTWKMRYFERLDLWKEKSPIYVFINGEWTANELFLIKGIMFDLVRETKGAMFSTEHRYYGKSKPFEELTTENLAYLSSRQALADVANFLKYIKMDPKYDESKVVVVGGSYSGNLAAWFKLLYPDSADAAIASSAPVLAEKDFYEYLENVSDDFEQYGTPGCYSKIYDMFHRYEKLFETGAGINQLKEEEEICDDTDLTKGLNKQLFFLAKTNQFMGEAQYGTPESIKTFCGEVFGNSRRVFTRNYQSGFWRQEYTCYDYDFDSMVQSMKEVDWVISWTYQTCTEFGYFPTTTSGKQPFTDNIHVDFFSVLCTKLFGPEFDEKRIDEGIKYSNDLYGGLRPNVTNVVFVNGDLDPYHRLGVLEDVSYDAPAKIIQQGSHCQDLLSDKSKDAEALKEGRKYIRYLIKKWIGAGEFKNPKNILS